MKKRLAMITMALILTACGSERNNKVGRTDEFSELKSENTLISQLDDTVKNSADDKKDPDPTGNAEVKNDTGEEYTVFPIESLIKDDEDEVLIPDDAEVTPIYIPAVVLQENSAPVFDELNVLPIYSPTPIQQEEIITPVSRLTMAPQSQGAASMGTSSKGNVSDDVQPTPIPTVTKTASVVNNDPVITPASVPFPTLVIRKEAPFDTSPKTDPDTTPPRFINFSTKITHPLGYAFDMKDYCVYADDRDSNVETTISGLIDIYKEGVYTVKFILTDDAGNVSKLTVAVTVSASAPKPVEKTKKVIDYTEVTEIKKNTKPVPVPAGRETFSDFAKKYKTENTFVGIDVSKYQAGIDFERVAAAGCEFVMIRIGGYTQDYYFKDPYFKINIKNAKAAGLKVGVYWLSEESNVSMMQESITHLMDYLDGESLDLPIAFDWEMINHIHEYGMSIKDLNDCFEVFCDLVEARGYEPCLYSSKYYLNQAWENVRNHRVWLANYTDKTEYQGDYFMWQHTDKGRIDGIYADVDFNVLYAK